MATLLQIALWNAAAAAVLALVAAAAARLFRRPALTHTLWVLVLLKLVTPPFIPFSLTLPTFSGRAGDVSPLMAPAAEVPVAPAPDEPEPPAADVPEGGEDALPAALPEPDPTPSVVSAVDWDQWAMVAWLLGSALWAAWVVWHVLRFRRVLRLARLAPGPLQGEAEALARRMGLRKCPDVWLVPGAVSPMVWALARRPCLLFPTGLLDRLDAGGRAAVLAHELAHVRRRDHWVRLLELAATGLYWWHPALWWARRELHEAEEQCCDAWAVWALGGEARPYALALVQAVAFVSQARLPLPLGASGVGQVSHLKRRLAMVMQGKTSRSLSWAGLGVVCGLGLLLLPLFPALGQQPPQLTPGALEPPREVPRDARDRQIEELRRVLRALEVQRDRDHVVRVGEDEPEDQNLQAQLKELQRVIAAKRKELADLQAKAERLQAQLQERTSRPRADAGPRNRTPAPPAAPRSPAGRVEDLEKKLDQIQKDLDELRRELRPGRVAPGRRPAPSPDSAPAPAPRPPSITAPADPALPTAPVLPPGPAGDTAPLPPTPAAAPLPAGGALPPAAPIPPAPPGAIPSAAPLPPTPPANPIPPAGDTPPRTLTVPRS
jgi:beta-lactamase regulating signal transducer with metallopeptidase domain